MSETTREKKLRDKPKRTHRLGTVARELIGGGGNGMGWVLVVLVLVVLVLVVVVGLKM